MALNQVERAAERGEAASPRSGAPVIEVKGVSKWFSDLVAVSDVSFRIDPGVTGLLGPNGAGKTTLFKMLAGLTKPSAGSLQVLGKPVRGDTRLYRHMALVPEQEDLYPFLTGREFVRLNAIMQHVPEAEEATQRVLSTVELLGDADRPLKGYSKGMRQRAKIAAALVHEPDVLILDEPLNGTDPLQRARLIELMRRLGAEGRTLVVSSHILHEVERFADQILVMVNGKLAAAGNFHTIRDKLDEHAHTIRVRTNEPRRLAAALVQLDSLKGVRVTGADEIVVETGDARDFYRRIAKVARDQAVRLYGVAALDDSLESVVAFVTER
jgi:ABC-2 type transport system ATP-binding protein